jgi:hypothetical protein
MIFDLSGDCSCVTIAVSPNWLMILYYRRTAGDRIFQDLSIIFSDFSHRVRIHEKSLNSINNLIPTHLARGESAKNIVLHSV